MEVDNFISKYIYTYMYTKNIITKFFIIIHFHTVINNYISDHIVGVFYPRHQRIKENYYTLQSCPLKHKSITVYVSDLVSPSFPSVCALHMDSFIALQCEPPEQYPTDRSLGCYHLSNIGSVTSVINAAWYSRKSYKVCKHVHLTREDRQYKI